MKNNKKKILKKETKKTSIKDILNNPKTIIIVLMVLFLLACIALVTLKSQYKFYSGEIVSEDITVAEIHFYKDPKFNYFYSNNALYSGEEKEIYYIKAYYLAGNKELEVYETEYDEPHKLSESINFATKFKIAENDQTKENVLTKDTVKNMDKLTLVIQASTKKDKTIDFERKLNVQVLKASK